MDHERTEKQMETSKKNLAKGRRKVHRWASAERRALAFPFGHTFPILDHRTDPVDILRWQMGGDQISREQELPVADRIVSGWRKENLQARRSLLEKFLFKSKPTITVEKLLQSLLWKLDGWSERRDRVQQMIENFQTLINWAGMSHYRALEDRKLLLGITRLEPGETSHGIYAGMPMLQVLSDPDTPIDLAMADDLVSVIVAFSDTFCSKSAAAYRNAMIGAEKRRRE